MALYEWNDSKYALGLPEIDAQHKALFGMVNELHEAMLTGQAATVVGSLLDRLTAYVRTHFEAEERMMAGKGYSELRQHHLLHDSFTARLEQFVDAHRKGAAALSIELMSFLGNWLAKHIMVSDRAYLEEFLRSA